MHIMVFGGTSPMFYREGGRGAKNFKFWATFSTRFGIGGLQFHKWEDWRNIENQKHNC